MLAALGTLAFAASMMAHEGLGHGGYCLAVGGHNTLLTPWSETCHFPASPRLGIKAAGPAVQFGFGLLAWLGLHWVKLNAARLRYFLWLCMTLSLFISFGYVALNGILNAGDAAELMAQLHNPLVWRSFILLLGSTGYFLSMRAAAYELRRFAGSDGEIQRLFRPCLDSLCKCRGLRLLHDCNEPDHRTRTERVSNGVPWLESYGRTAWFGSGIFVWGWLGHVLPSSNVA